MNRTEFEKNWHHYKGKIQSKWNKLTNEEIAKCNGKYDLLLGMIEKKYGLRKEQIEKELTHLCEGCCQKMENQHNKPMHKERNQNSKEEHRKTG